MVKVIVNCQLFKYHSILITITFVYLYLHLEYINNSILFTNKINIVNG